MLCPYCNMEMEKGSIGQHDLTPITWISNNVREDAVLPIHKTIKLTALLKGGEITTYYCENCNKFIIDGKEIKR